MSKLTDADLQLVRDLRVVDSRSVVEAAQAFLDKCDIAHTYRTERHVAAIRAALATREVAEPSGVSLDVLEDIILNGGLRLPGFDHWRERASSKASDPDDVRWDCSCGYSGSPETVQRHWRALRRG